MERPGAEGHHQPRRSDTLHERANVGEHIRDEEIAKRLDP
jgi:hypothetical protein